LPPTAKAVGDKNAKIIKKTIRQERIFFMGVLLKLSISFPLV
jgi:hypothetical protein